MERWAKTLNQKKDVARLVQVANQSAQIAAKSAATADIAFSVLERQEAGQYDLPLPSTAAEVCITCNPGHFEMENSIFITLPVINCQSFYQCFQG